MRQGVCMTDADACICRMSCGRPDICEAKDTEESEALEVTAYRPVACTYSVTYSGLLCFFSRFGRLELFVTFLACKECFFTFPVFGFQGRFTVSGEWA